MFDLELWLPNYLFFIFSPLHPSIMHMYIHLFSQRRAEDPLLCICFRDSSRKTCKNKFELEIYKYIFFLMFFFSYMPIIHTAASWHHEFQILFVFHVFLPSDGLCESIRPGSLPSQTFICFLKSQGGRSVQELWSCRDNTSRQVLSARWWKLT